MHAVLVHADDGRVDHLNGGIMGSGERVHDPAPDTGPSPTNVAAEMALHILAYNLTRVMNIVGKQKLISAICAA